MRVNNQIRVSPVRLIGVDGNQIGIMDVKDALLKARKEDLDLVEISPTAKPPVCRIMDYGKYKYEQSKKVKDARKKQHVIHLKEIKLRPRTDDHDFQFKMKHARNFLEHHDRVKITLVFRGREITHKEFGEKILNRVKEELSDICTVEGNVKFEGRNMILILTPKIH